MELEVYLYASLAKYLPQDAAEKRIMVSAPEGSTARGILEQLNVDEKEVKIAFVNGVRKGLDTRVAHGDRIGFFPPVGGG